MGHRAEVRAALVVAAAIVATVHRAAAGPPSGYRCGSDGALVEGKGCRCAPAKVEARDMDDNAICVPRPARRPQGAPQPGHGPRSPTETLAEREAPCHA